MISYCAKENKEKEKTVGRKSSAIWVVGAPCLDKGSIKMAGIEEFGKNIYFLLKLM